jgi:hypothetical protein
LLPRSGRPFSPARTRQHRGRVVRIRSSGPEASREYPPVDLVAGLPFRYAQAHAYIASGLQWEMNCSWMENDAQGYRGGGSACTLGRAVTTQRSEGAHPSCLRNRSLQRRSRNGDLETVIHWFDHAIRLNPNSAMTFGREGGGTQFRRRLRNSRRARGPCDAPQSVRCRDVHI